MSRSNFRVATLPLSCGRALVAVFAAVALALTGLAVSPASAHAETRNPTVTNPAVKAWGRNDVGQLGDGTRESRLTPVDVLGLTNVQAIGGGGYGGYALLSDGTVKAWGYNSNGQLGNGSAELLYSSTPITIPNLTDVQAIGTGFYSGYALLPDHTVKAWGRNFYGQLGDGTTQDRFTPVAVSDLTDVKAIATGFEAGFALLNDGSVKAWGKNYSGQLGDGTNEDRHTPVTVSDLTSVDTIAAGYYSGYALLPDHTVKAWGNNQHGQLGDGTTSNHPTPIVVPGLTNVKAIAAGYFSVYALLEDGTVKAWGDNSDGQLGDGTTEESSIPKTVPGLTNVQAIASGYSSGYALLEDGTVKAWGDNSNGQLGDGTTENRLNPVPVEGLTGVQAISSGAFAGYALLAPPDTNTTLAADQSLVTEGDEVTFTATVAPAAAGSVEFFNGTDSLGTAPTDADTGVATLVIDTLPVGTNSVTAVFTPADATAFNPSTSNEVTVTVAAEETEPPSTPDNGGTPEGGGETGESDGEPSESDGETTTDTTLPETGDNDNPVEILGLISASLLAAGISLKVARRSAAQ